MATVYLLVLAVTCLSAHAFPQNPLPQGRNTITFEERQEGGAFEYLNNFNDLTFNTGSDNAYRLPRTTLPKHYKVLWTIDTYELWFSGNVEIELYATEANMTDIVLHAHDLNVTDVSLSRDGEDIPIQNYVFEPEHHFLRIRLLNRQLEYVANQEILYTLSIDFNAPLRTDMYGIYQSWFRNNVTDEVSWMASTQFQATAARFAFPCYDEPSFKADFDVTIRRPSHYTSWFCTKLNYTTPNSIPGYDDDIYTTTPTMSTYLLALIVAEYTSRPYNSPDGTLLYEVIARPRAMELNQGDYAFYVGQELLDEMSNHTDYDFFLQSPNLKMTQAAIPDFGAGAMENWGLLTYREAYLMYDEEHTNGYFKQLIAYILSHEIAHMWFGNLVTCDWWDVLWLNEGFARYYQYFLTDWVEEYMGLGTRFITEQVHASLLSDSANNPHALTNPGVGSPGSVSAMFSTITYNKGAAVIRMTEHLLGSDVHRAGLRTYLREREFETALPIDLFQHLQAAAVAENAISEYGPGFNVIDYYKSWTEQGGHPVLNVEVDHSTGLMTIYQRRFNINTGYSTAASNWIIPITFTTPSIIDFNNTKPTHIIQDAITIINRTTIGDEWVIFNKQQTGFYRVNYDDYTWDLIAIALRGPDRTRIHEYNKAQIVNDVFQYARSGIMTYTRALNLLSFLENETEYAPWVAAVTAVNWIRNRLQGSDYLDNFEAIFRGWTQYVMNTIGYTPDDGEEFMTSYLRYQLAPFVCNLGVTQCRDSARVQFNNLRVSGTEVFVDNRNWVYCNALRQGSVEDFNFLWERFLEHDVYTEKILLLQTLGCTPHRESLYRFLDGMFNEDHVIRPQDYTTAFNSAVSGNEGNTQLVFEYIKENFENVTSAFNSVTTPFSYISSRLRSDEDILAFQEWADEARFQLGTAYQSVRNGVSTSRGNLDWAIEVRDDIVNYITEDPEVITTSTAAPVVVTVPSTVTPSALVEAPTPSLPTTTPPSTDSANTAVLSALTIALAFIANFAM